MGINSIPTLRAVNLLLKNASSLVRLPITFTLPFFRVIVESPIQILSPDGLVNSFLSSLTIKGVISSSKTQYAFSNSLNISKELFDLDVLVDIYLRPIIFLG